MDGPPPCALLITLNIPYIGCIKSLVLMKEMEEENGGKGMNALLGLRESLFLFTGADDIKRSRLVDNKQCVSMPTTGARIANASCMNMLSGSGSGDNSKKHHD